MIVRDGSEPPGLTDAGVGDRQGDRFLVDVQSENLWLSLTAVLVVSFFIAGPFRM